MKSSNASIVPQKVSANDMLATSYYNGIGHTKQGHFFHTYAPKRTKSRTENRWANWKNNNFSGHVAIDSRWSSPVRVVHGTVTLVDNANNVVIENTIQGVR